MIDVTRKLLVGRNGVVGETENAILFQHARHFMNRFRRIGIMMQRDAIGDQIKRVVVKRQRVRVRGFEFDVGDAAFVCKLARRIQHLRREVGSNDMRHQRREFERGMSRAGRNVQRPPIRLGLYELDETPKTLAARVNGAGRIFVGIGAELILNELRRIAHRVGSGTFSRSPFRPGTRTAWSRACSRERNENIISQVTPRRP